MNIESKQKRECCNCKWHDDCICVVCEDGLMVVCRLKHKHMNKNDFCERFTFQE